MRIKWLGHSCFKITSKEGKRIVIDPFDDNLGYKVPAVEADIVTVSHGHYDHNFIDCISGSFEVVKAVGDFEVKGVSIKGVHTFHDEVEGAKRGENVVFCYQIDGLNICHLGDLGHTLSDEHIDKIGKVDILLIPVGGTYTLDADSAFEVANALNPKVIIPMHYKTPALKLNLDTEEKFVAKFENVERLNSPLVEITEESLKEEKQKVYILKYE